MLGQSVNLLFRSSKRKDVLQYGIGNRCKGGGYVLFLDYDNVPYEWVAEEVRFLQERFRQELGKAFLFGTKNGIHVIFLEKHDLGSIISMMAVTSCDKDYKVVPLLSSRKIWVLRQSTKKDEAIKYLGALRAPCNWERSRAHALYLKQFCGVPNKDLIGGGAFDKEEQVVLGYYYVAGRNN